MQLLSKLSYGVVGASFIVGMQACVDEVNTTPSVPHAEVTDQFAPASTPDFEFPWVDVPSYYTDGDALVAAVREVQGRVIIGFKEPSTPKMHIRPTFMKDGVPHMLRPGVSAGTISAGREFLRAEGVEIIHLLNRVPSVVARIDPERALQLREKPLVDYIVPDQLLVPEGSTTGETTTGFSTMQSEPFDGDTIPWALDTMRVRDVHAQQITGVGVLVTVIDNGTEQHWDLPTITTCKVWASGSGCGSSADVYHGTRVAGAAVMRMNNDGWRGVAPSAALNVHRICDVPSGNCTVGNLIKAVDWVADNQSVREVVNMSIGFDGAFNNDLHNVIQAAFQAGDLLVAAAGNGQGSVRQPASMANVIAATVVNQDGTPRTDVRSGGVDIAAPHVFRRTTIGTSDFSTLLYTSGASAQVAGVAALVWQKNPNWSNVTLRSKLVSSASAVDVYTPGWDYRTGWGRIDAWKAVFGSPATLSASMSGPSTVSEPSTWYAHWEGGLAPWTWTWSGILTGGGTTVSGLPTASGYLYLTVRSFDGQQKTVSMYVTVEGGSGCGPFGC